MLSLSNSGRFSFEERQFNRLHERAKNFENTDPVLFCNEVKQIGSLKFIYKTENQNLLQQFRALQKTAQTYSASGRVPFSFEDTHFNSFHSRAKTFEDKDPILFYNAVRQIANLDFIYKPENQDLLQQFLALQKTAQTHIDRDIKKLIKWEARSDTIQNSAQLSKLILKVKKLNLAEKLNYFDVREDLKEAPHLVLEKLNAKLIEQGAEDFSVETTAAKWQALISAESNIGRKEILKSAAVHWEEAWLRTPSAGPLEQRRTELNTRAQMYLDEIKSIPSDTTASFKESTCSLLEDLNDVLEADVVYLNDLYKSSSKIDLLFTSTSNKDKLPAAARPLLEIRELLSAPSKGQPPPLLSASREKGLSRPLLCASGASGQKSLKKRVDPLPVDPLPLLRQTLELQTKLYEFFKTIVVQPQGSDLFTPLGHEPSPRLALPEPRDPTLALRALEYKPISLN